VQVLGVHADQAVARGVDIGNQHERDADQQRQDRQQLAAPPRAARAAAVLPPLGL